jgi:hypothetical protein
MLARMIALGLLLFFAALPSKAQRDMRDGRLGATTSSGAMNRAAESLDAKNNPELYRLSKKLHEGVSDLKEDLRATREVIPSVTLNEFSQMKLASREFKVKFGDIVDARRRAPDLEHALRELKINTESPQFRQKLDNVKSSARTVAPPQ